MPEVSFEVIISFCSKCAEIINAGDWVRTHAQLDDFRALRDPIAKLSQIWGHSLFLGYQATECESRKFLVHFRIGQYINSIYVSLVLVQSLSGKCELIF